MEENIATKTMHTFINLQSCHVLPSAMEEDRAQVDLGPSVTAENSADQREHIRKPKKRFVGRKTGTGEAAAKVEGGGNSSAIQSQHHHLVRPSAWQYKTN